MSNELNILCVYGAGIHSPDGDWQSTWQKAIETPLKNLEPNVSTQFEFLDLSSVFTKPEYTNLKIQDYAEAVYKLGTNFVASSLHRARGFRSVDEPSMLDRIGSATHNLQEVVKMVVGWAECDLNDPLRVETRGALAKMIHDCNPHIVCAHSLGSLVSYDLFSLKNGNLGYGNSTNGGEYIRDRFFISCGSQIGNPFVIRAFESYLVGLDTAKKWYHLYNPYDDVFTREIRLPNVKNFEQIETRFGSPFWWLSNKPWGIDPDHDAAKYMDRTPQDVWREMLMDFKGDASTTRHVNVTGSKPISKSRVSDTYEKPKPATRKRRKALLVGINEYPNPQNNLEGCVNDVFIMSELLQESGFDAEDIRIVLNNRATYAGIRERLEWLLDDGMDNDIRLFYYSGHGAQIPGYGFGEVIDRLDETLVPYDFDWTRERAFTDDDFYMLYSLLPYDLRFITIFDCCHSGGMTRASNHKVRGINPPDDIRHRMLKWGYKDDDGKKEDEKAKGNKKAKKEVRMWFERAVEPANLFYANKFKEKAEKYARQPKQEPKETIKQSAPSQGKTGVTIKQYKLGQVMNLRGDLSSDEIYNIRDHKGPYLPVLIYACGEEEMSYEYRHGAISYGAFTYSFVQTLRNNPGIVLNDLIWRVRDTLSNLYYEQRPIIIMPSDREQFSILSTDNNSKAS